MFNVYTGFISKIHIKELDFPGHFGYNQKQSRFGSEIVPDFSQSRITGYPALLEAHTDMKKSPFTGKKFQTLLSYFLLALSVIVTYQVILNFNTIIASFKWLIRVISPFISGFLLAYVLNIPCGGIMRLLGRGSSPFIQKRRKLLSIIIVYILAAFIVFLALSRIVPSVSYSIYNFSANFTNYTRSAQEFFDYVNSLDILGINISIDSVMQSIREFSIQILPMSFDALRNVSAGILNIFLMIISSVYILLEKESFKKYLKRVFSAFLPENFHHAILKYTANLNNNFKQYIYKQTIDGCILGTIATIELFLLGSPYALVLGLMLGIVNYIPYFGSIFGSIFAVLVVAFTQDIAIAALTAVILLVTQQIDANVIQPRLMSGSFSISPLLIVISITIGGAFSGILGMIIAAPVVAVIKDILEEIIQAAEKRKKENET